MVGRVVARRNRFPDRIWPCVADMECMPCRCAGKAGPGGLVWPRPSSTARLGTNAERLNQEIGIGKGYSSG